MEKDTHKQQRYRVPDWCTRICLAAESTACAYHCAKTRQGIYFLLIPALSIENMPPFPLDDWIHNTSPKERQIIAGAYLTKLVEQAQGKKPKSHHENDDLAEFIAGDIDSWVQAIIESSAE